MPAYIIVEIDIVDPVGYEEYKKLAGATVEKYGGNTSSVAAGRKRWKATGNRSASWCSNSNQHSGPRNGSIARNTKSRARCATAQRRQT